MLHIWSWLHQNRYKCESLIDRLFEITLANLTVPLLSRETFLYFCLKLKTFFIFSHKWRFKIPGWSCWYNLVLLTLSAGGVHFTASLQHVQTCWRSSDTRNTLSAASLFLLICFLSLVSLSVSSQVWWEELDDRAGEPTEPTQSVSPLSLFKHCLVV